MQFLTQTGGPADEYGEGGIVHRDDCLHSKQAHRHGCCSRSHGVVVTDGQKSDIGGIDFANKCHVGEHCSITSKIDLEAIFELNDKANRLANIHRLPVGSDTRCMDGMSEGHRDTLSLDCSTYAG